MSLVAKAAALAAALSTVEGVTGHPNGMPAAPRVGDAWVQMGRGERATGDAFTVAWRVRLCVPTGDEQGALTMFDGLWEDLFYALVGAGTEPDAFAPVVVVTKAGDVWAYEIVCRTGD
jgi:hypothetical protein